MGALKIQRILVFTLKAIKFIREMSVTYLLENFPLVDLMYKCRQLDVYKDLSLSIYISISTGICIYTDICIYICSYIYLSTYLPTYISIHLDRGASREGRWL